MTMTEVYAADLGSNPYGSDERSSGLERAYVATFNTPSDSFNTIVMPKVYGGNAGDVIKVSVFKGSIPRDPNDGGADDNETPAKLDVNDFVEEATYNVTTAIAAGGIDLEFSFSTTFTRSLLGDTYTVVVEQFDNTGAYVPFSIVFCTDRDGVHNYINDDDAGHLMFINGGAGNVYYLNGATINLYNSFNISADKYTVTLTTSNWTVDGTATHDPCPAWGIYSREELVTLASIATHPITADMTAPVVSSLIN